MRVCELDEEGEREGREGERGRESEIERRERERGRGRENEITGECEKE